MTSHNFPVWNWLNLEYFLICVLQGVAKRKAREMPHLNMSSNKDPEEQGSNEELEEQE